MDLEATRERAVVAAAAAKYLDVWRHSLSNVHSSVFCCCSCRASSVVVLLGARVARTLFIPQTTFWRRPGGDKGNKTVASASSLRFHLLLPSPQNSYVRSVISCRRFCWAWDHRFWTIQGCSRVFEIIQELSTDWKWLLNISRTIPQRGEGPNQKEYYEHGQTNPSLVNHSFLIYAWALTRLAVSFAHLSDTETGRRPNNNPCLMMEYLVMANCLPTAAL